MMVIFGITYIFFRSKGHEAVKFTWVKGHATQLHIIRGITSKIDKEGNDKDDELRI